MDIQAFQSARQSRDPRFDGVFYVAVKSTGIFCRPVCPANLPKEENVEYFSSASEALVSGYRPCLRCRPESAPFSPAWSGSEEKLHQALAIIHQQGLHDLKLADIAAQLKVSDRYVRKLFVNYLGVSPKAYIQHQQVLFAKNLLHDTHLTVEQIAYAAGFNNVRRFNDTFKTITKKTPSQFKKRRNDTAAIRLLVHYQKPFDWQHWINFVNKRQMENIEHIGSSSYSRTFHYQDGGKFHKGWFNAVHRPDKQGFNISIEIEHTQHLYTVVQTIRRIFDLNANMQLIEEKLVQAGLPQQSIQPGIRIPGCWNAYEAGIKAILGQQVSVAAATQLTNQIISELGQHKKRGEDTWFWFPTPQKVAKSDLSFLAIPQARKDTLQAFSRWYINHPDPDDWLSVKGIGPWTVDYAKLRGQSHTNIWLDTDLGIKKALDVFPQIDANKASPWGSYLTFQLWNKL